MGAKGSIGMSGMSAGGPQLSSVDFFGAAAGAGVTWLTL